MATIEDLKVQSITEMSRDEAIEYLRQLRLSRRVPVKKVSKSVKNKISQTKVASKISAKQAQELLKLLGGK